MSARMRNRSDQLERVARGVLALVLIAGVAWALTHAGGNAVAGMPSPLH